MTEPTPATHAIAAAGIPHRVVRTERAHSAEESAQLQRIELGALLRTIVVRRGEDDYLFVLVPGGRRFDRPKVRTHLGVKRLSLPDADEARDVTGYERGAITPFGASRPLPVIVDASAMGRSVVAIGGGAHGVNLHLAPRSTLSSPWVPTSSMSRSRSPSKVTDGTPLAVARSAVWPGSHCPPPS